MDIQLSLNKIADTLRVSIDYEDGKVSGTTDFLYSPLPGLTLPATLTIKKMFANESVGIVAHIMGDLHIVVSHFLKTGAVNVFLIDGNKLSMDGVKAPPEMFVSKTMDLKQVVSALRQSIVTSFLYKDRKWSILKLPA